MTQKPDWSMVLYIGSIAAQDVNMQFDNVPAPCKIYMIRSRFMVMENFYICVSETYHLSLDCAILDLSEEVFSDGMAYICSSIQGYNYRGHCS